MKGAPCPRLFEVEAARDGRLTGAELAGFERHMTGCRACLREAEALEGLAAALRSAPGGRGGADMLHARRERTRLLAAFDRTMVAPDHRSGARRVLLGSAAVAAVVTCVLVLSRARPGAQPVHPGGALVRAEGTAVWSERRDGNRDVVDLQDGALWIHVDHAPGDGHLLVELPDGELEDTGTTFTVSAEDGHTTRVAVQEGHVVLRVRGQAAVAVGPGDTWTLGPRAAVSASASAVPPASTAPAARPASPSASTPPASASDSSADFRSAMAALDVGENSRAATAFALFLERHPRDPRAEDAAYLRVIALQRAGDSAAMKRAALEYLRRYPGGFREAEIERLARW